jgi:hypothetical protein
MKASDLRETLGFLGVAASLVFVGLEIRQNTAVARGQARQELAALNQEWLILQSTDSTFSDIYRKAWIEPDSSLTASELARANWALRLNLRRLENVYFQFKEGLVDESALGSYGFQVSGFYRSPTFREFWVTRDERRAYDPDFVRFFEERFELAPK